MSWQEEYKKRFYGSEGFKDGTSEFHELVAARVGRVDRILEVGAGPSNPSSRYVATLGELHGVDVDPEVETNDALATASLVEDGRFPFADGTFDGAVSNFVLEHVEQPDLHLAEVCRVLKPGGSYVFRTPNRYHYVTLVAASTPYWFHVLVANRLRNLPQGSHDPYPAMYRLNTRRAIHAGASRSGMAVEWLSLIEKEPSYGMASRWLFWPFMAYERLVNSTDLLQIFRGNILGVLRKRRSRPARFSSPSIRSTA